MYCGYAFASELLSQVAGPSVLLALHGGTPSSIAPSLTVFVILPLLSTSSHRHDAFRQDLRTRGHGPTIRLGIGGVRELPVSCPRYPRQSRTIQRLLQEVD